MGERKQHIRDYMLSQHEKSWRILRSIRSDELATSVYTSHEAEWTVGDILAHLADSESGLLAQARRITKGEQTLPKDFDLDRWNRAVVRKRSGRNFQDHLDEIQDSFQAAMRFLEQVDPGDLDRRGRHSSGAMLSVEEYLRRIVDHRREHAQDLKQALGG